MTKMFIVHSVQDEKHVHHDGPRSRRGAHTVGLGYRSRGQSFCRGFYGGEWGDMARHEKQFSKGKSGGM